MLKRQLSKWALLELFFFSLCGAISKSSGILRLHRHCYLRGHDGCVNTCAWAPDGKHVITGSDDTYLLLWDATEFTKKLSISTPHTRNIFSAITVGNSMVNDPIVSSCKRVNLV